MQACWPGSLLKVPTLTGQDSRFRLGMASVAPNRSRTVASSSRIGETGFLGPETNRPKSHSGPKRCPRRPKRSRGFLPSPGNLAVRKNAWWWMQSGSNRSPPRNSLLAGKRTGNFAESGPPEAIFAHSRPANSVPCSKIPYAMEQGIFWKDGLHPRERTGR